MLDTATIRPQFPILETSVHGKPLIYLDNAATTQKPLAVLDAIRHYYDTENANVHRGSHYLSQLATEAHEESRETVARFINAPETAEVLFTSGCTMGINLAADTIAASGMVKPGDEVIVTASEHHSPDAGPDSGHGSLPEHAFPTHPHRSRGTRFQYAGNG